MSEKQGYLRFYDKVEGIWKTTLCDPTMCVADGTYCTEHLVAVSIKRVQDMDAELSRLRSDNARLQSTEENLRVIIGQLNAAIHRVADVLGVGCCAGVDVPKDGSDGPGGHTGKMLEEKANELRTELKRLQGITNLEEYTLKCADRCGVLEEVFQLAVAFADQYDGPGRTKESRALLAKVRYLKGA